MSFTLQAEYMTCAFLGGGETKCSFVLTGPWFLDQSDESFILCSLSVKKVQIDRKYLIVYFGPVDTATE